MVAITLFPARAQGLADRMSGFMAHLRMNGINAGPPDTALAIEALSNVESTRVDTARSALRTVLIHDQDSWERFDELFDSYWFNAGKTAQKEVANPHIKVQSARPKLWQPHFEPQGGGAESEEEADQPEDGHGEAEGRDGRLIATKTANLAKRDLREVMDEETLREAEKIALRLAQVIRDRTSRRQKAAKNGARLDLRKVQRKSLATGGEPLHLAHRTRPPRPMKIVALCDVSGSMTVYSRVFLAFLKGLVSADTATDAYLFHTKLLRVTPALRDHDTLRAAGRLSLMAEGFGGGTDIQNALRQFVEGHGSRALTRRTMVVILSDGYSTGDCSEVGEWIGRIRRKARRVVWLNPLKGWQDYEAISQAMQACAPHLDAHLPANTIEALGALEDQFRRL